MQSFNRIYTSRLYWKQSGSCNSIAVYNAKYAAGIGAGLLTMYYSLWLIDKLVFNIVPMGIRHITLICLYLYRNVFLHNAYIFWLLSEPNGLILVCIFNPHAVRPKIGSRKWKQNHQDVDLDNSTIILSLRATKLDKVRTER